MYKVAIRNEIKDSNEILKRFHYDCEMRLDTGKTIKAKEVYQFLSDNQEVMMKEKVIQGEHLQTWTHGLPGGDLEFLKNSTAILHSFDNSLGTGITYGLTVDK